MVAISCLFSTENDGDALICIGDDAPGAGSRRAAGTPEHVRAPGRAEATALRDERIAEAKAGRYAEMQAANFPQLVHPRRVRDRALIEMMEQTREESGPDAYIRQQIAIIARIDSRPFLKHIRVPTLVLSGDKDMLISNELSREMAAMIPGATLVIVPSCGHLAPAEQPEAVSAALDAWLRRPL